MIREFLEKAKNEYENNGKVESNRFLSLSEHDSNIQGLLVHLGLCDLECL